MENKQVAQEVLDKIKGVTPSSRFNELKEAFEAAGIKLSDDIASVLSVVDSEAFKALASNLKSTMPTAMISAKRVLGSHDINI